ncbi:MAG: hypothetical protein KC933_02465 [Myxococcales bacterium]|nr:hypothetical protein [Myxococcales bacterium]
MKLSELQGGLQIEAEVEGPPVAWSGGALEVLPLARFFDRDAEDPSLPGERETTLRMPAPETRAVELPEASQAPGEVLEVVRREGEVTLRHVVRWQDEAEARAVRRVAREAVVLRRGGQP